LTDGSGREVAFLGIAAGLGTVDFGVEGPAGLAGEGVAGEGEEPPVPTETMSWSPFLIPRVESRIEESSRDIVRGGYPDFTMKSIVSEGTRKRLVMGTDKLGHPVGYR
jgi:hypothetical protein